MQARQDIVWGHQEEAIISSHFFMPFSPGFLTADSIIGFMGASFSLPKIEEALQQFLSAGLIEKAGYYGEAHLHYSTRRKGWDLREYLLRKHNRRRNALAQLESFELEDVVLAVLMSPQLENQRMKGAFLGHSPRVRSEILFFYQAARSCFEVRGACDRLAERGIILKRYDGTSGEITYEVSGLGKLAYDSARERLGLSSDDSILDVDPFLCLTIFNAWQSEFTASHIIISHCLKKIVKELNSRHSFARPLKVVEATEAGDGAVRIDVAVQENIAAADIFIGDLTPVYAYDGRLRVNENVLVEVGFALASKFPEQIVLLEMRRDKKKIKGDALHAKPAFDIAHVRRIMFANEENLERKLGVEISACLKKRGYGLGESLREAECSADF